MAASGPLHNALALRSDPLAFFAGVAARGERISPIDLPARRVHLVNEPELVAQLLLGRAGKLRKHLFPGIREAFGSGILNSSGTIHSAVRQAAQPAFHRHQIDKWNGSVENTIAESLSLLAGSEEVDIKGFFERATLVIVARLLFGLDVRDIAGEFFALVEEMQRFFQQIEVSPAAATQFHEASRRLDLLLDQIIREQPAARHDGILLRALSSVAEMSDEQMLNEVRGFLMASMPVTMLLGTACWLLARHPEEQTHLRQSQGGVAQENVVNETLRLYPPAWLLGRETVEPFQFDGCTFPPETVFLVCLWTLHRSPRFFANPDDFLPARWNATLELPRGVYIPFSLGARNCLGERLSRLIAQHGLTQLLQRFRIIVTAQHGTVRWLPRMTLSPAGAIPVKLEKLSTV